jgi:hypothetical protein
MGRTPDYSKSPKYVDFRVGPPDVIEAELPDFFRHLLFLPTWQRATALRHLIDKAGSDAWDKAKLYASDRYRALNCKGCRKKRLPVSEG